MEGTIHAALGSRVWHEESLLVQAHSSPEVPESQVSSEPWIVTDSYRYKLYLPLGSNSQESRESKEMGFSPTVFYFFPGIQFPSLPAYLGS